MPPHTTSAPYVLTRDTTCREGCPHYGHQAPPHRHWQQEQPPEPARQDGPIMRALVWAWGDWGISKRQSRPAP
jgi:hypothetical protein